MIYAIDETGKRRRPKEAKGKCICPICEAPVVKKQGSIYTDHFAHQSREQCDPWTEQPGPWHHLWQMHVEPKRREALCKTPKYPNEVHRADMLTPNGFVAEVQHSSISVVEVMEREQFYGTCHRGMVWVIDASEFWERIEISHPKLYGRELVGKLKMDLNHGGETRPVNFNWSHPRLAWLAANSPVYLDPGRLGDDTRVFDGALFKIMEQRQGDPDRWSNYDPHDERHQTPDGEGPGGIGCFVSMNKFRWRYKLRLPDKDQQHSSVAYPAPGPHFTRSSGNVSNSDTIPVQQLIDNA